MELLAQQAQPALKEIRAIKVKRGPLDLLAQRDQLAQLVQQVPKVTLDQQELKEILEQQAQLVRMALTVLMD
jgi:hypothetical protein